MALADIVRRIAEDARREAHDLVLAAEGAASEARGEAEERAQRERERIVAHGRAEAEAEARTRLATVRLAERDRALTTKRELVRRVLDGAVARIESLPDEEYAALIAREVRGIVRGGEHLVLGERDHPRLVAALPAALDREGLGIEIGSSTAATEKGVLLLGERMRVEISARALVEGRADRLTAVAGEILFGEAGAAADGEG